MVLVLEQHVPRILHFSLSLVDFFYANKRYTGASVLTFDDIRETRHKAPFTVYY